MELLSPAGDLNKLKYAVYYGADAVYASGQYFGLRAKSTNFNREQLKKAVKFCHDHHRKIYVTVNIFALNRDIKALPEYLQFLQSIQVDALIISDPGVFALAREYAPQIKIHVSTQANVTSWSAAKFWFDQGAARIILARELNIKDIAEIKQKVPEIELEIFVQGAMCMSYSGRCLISAFLNDRSANQGLCTQPCRWEYDLVERSRPGEQFRIEQDKYGSYFFNSKDLNLINRIAEITELELDSVKIEGRMKSIYYVAAVTRAYRSAIDIGNNKISDNIKNELNKISHRRYSESFFNSNDSKKTQYYGSSAYIREYQFIGEITKTIQQSAFIAIRSKFSVDDTLEFIFPDFEDDFQYTVKEIFDEENIAIQSAKPNTTIRLDLDNKIPNWGIVRKKNNED
ncbi:MAG: U32 family peptidase [Candidatus Cloacimonetes bacterium]|nr:U32 family peptidase [Candidatus Cloacimonadota bacterium]